MAATKASGKAAAKPAEETAPRNCRCGCGGMVAGRSTFKQGHDAKWASQLKAAVREGSMSRADALVKAGEVSPLMLSKVTRSLDLLAKELAKAQAKPDEAAK